MQRLCGQAALRRAGAAPLFEDVLHQPDAAPGVFQQEAHHRCRSTRAGFPMLANCLRRARIARYSWRQHAQVMHGTPGLQ